MSVYKLLDGVEHGAINQTDFVKQLRTTSFFPCETVEDYMMEFAKRVYVLYSSHVRTDSADNFVNDLIKLKIVYILDLN